MKVRYLLLVLQLIIGLVTVTLATFGSDLWFIGLGLVWAICFACCTAPHLDKKLW